MTKPLGAKRIESAENPLWSSPVLDSLSKYSVARSESAWEIAFLTSDEFGHRRLFYFNTSLIAIRYKPSFSRFQAALP
jgi:hypothetical protein